MNPPLPARHKSTRPADVKIRHFTITQDLLNTLVDDSDTLMTAGLGAPDTIRSRFSILRRYQHFVYQCMTLKGVAASSTDETIGLPLEFDLVLLFTQYLINTQLKLSAVDKYQRDLNLAAQALGYSDALFVDVSSNSSTRTTMGKRLARHLKGAAKFDGRPSTHVLALTIRIILRVLDTIASKAISAFPAFTMFRAWSVLRHRRLARATETTNAHLVWADIEFLNDGSLVVNIARAKRGNFMTRIFKTPKRIAVNRNKRVCVVNAMRIWRRCCKRLGLKTTGDAPVFRNHIGHKQIGHDRLSYRAALIMLRHYLQLGGIERADLFGTHSFRAGGLMDLIRLGISREDRKNIGDWKSDKGMLPYERTDQNVLAHAFDELDTLTAAADTDDLLFADAKATINDTIFETDSSATFALDAASVPDPVASLDDDVDASP